MQTPNAITWFAMIWVEDPAADTARASRFYDAVLGKPLEKQSVGSHELMEFPYQRPSVGGCLISNTPLQAGAAGPVIYLSVDDTFDKALTRVTPAGGTVVLGRTELPGNIGCYAHIIDTEGNRVGLHAAN